MERASARSAVLLSVVVALAAGACGPDEAAESTSPVPGAGQAATQTTLSAPPPAGTVAPFPGESVSGERIAVIKPPAWDVRVLRNGTDGAGASAHALVQAGNFTLPASPGTLGRGAVETMSADHVFVALVEAGAESAARGLYAPAGVPLQLPPSAFSPDALERALPGQAGVQRFFTQEGRPFTLYVVLGSYANRETLVPLVNRFLAGVTIRPLS